MKSVLALGLGSFFALSIASADQRQQTTQPLVPSGDTVADSSVAERIVTAENSQKSAEEIRVTHPEISRDLLTVYMIDRVVLTSNGTLDLYAGQTLWLTLEKQGQVFAVRASAYEFEPVTIEHTMSLDRPSLVNGLDFTFQGCTPAQQDQQDQRGGQQPTQQETPVRNCETVRVHLGLAEIVVQ